MMKIKLASVMNVQRKSGRKDQSEFRNSYTVLLGSHQRNFSSQFFCDLTLLIILRCWFDHLLTICRKHFFPTVGISVLST